MASRSPRWRGWARCSRPSASRAARAASRSSVLGLGAVTACRPSRTVELDHPLALLKQVGRQAGPVAAGAFDRPDPAGWCLLDGEPVNVQVATGVGGEGPMCKRRTGRGHHRGGVGGRMGLDPDDVVDAICQPAAAASFAGWRWSVPALARETAWQDCDGSRRTADRLLIRPTLRGARPAPAPRQTVQCQGSPSGRQLRCESCRGTSTDPDSDPSRPPRQSHSCVPSARGHAEAPLLRIGSPRPAGRTQPPPDNSLAPRPQLVAASPDILDEPMPGDHDSGTTVLLEPASARATP
jgi:hypothetical protein